jgi:hypothetical protein
MSSKKITEPYQFVGFINKSTNERLTKIKKQICQKYGGDFVSVKGNRVDDDSRVIIIFVKKYSNEIDPYKEQRKKLHDAVNWESSPPNDPDEDKKALRAYFDFQEKYPFQKYPIIHRFKPFTLSSSGICGIYLPPMTEDEAIDFFVEKTN